MIEQIPSPRHGRPATARPADAKMQRQSVAKALTWAWSRRGEAVALLSLLASNGVNVSTVVMVARTWSPLPYWDQWGDLITGRHVTLTWLFSQHNEHRLAVPRLVFWADKVLAHETNALDLAVGLAIQGVLAWQLIGLARQIGLARRSETLLATALITAVLFSAIQWENFTWGYQIQFFGVDLAAVATFLVLARYEPPGWLSLTAVIILEAIAAFTLSNGLLVAFCAVGMAVRLGYRPRHIVILGIAAITLAFAYLYGYHSPSYHSDPLETIFKIGAVLAYAATELGTPLESLMPVEGIDLAIWLGAAGLLLFVIAALSSPRPATRNGRADLAFVTIMAFVVATTLITALGRLRFGLEQAHAVRYATPVMLFWLSLILLGLSRLRGSLRACGFVVLAFCPLLLAVREHRFVHQAEATVRGRFVGEPALLTGVDDRDFLLHVYPDSDSVLASRDALKRARTSVFAFAWADWLGHPMPYATTTRNAPPCPGGFDDLKFVSDAHLPGWRAEGRMPTHGFGHWANRIIFLDPEGLVIGYGISGLTGNDIGNKEASDDPSTDRWIGAVENIDPASVTAYALRADDRVLCSLGSARAVIR